MPTLALPRRGRLAALLSLLGAAMAFAGLAAVGFALGGATLMVMM